MGALVSSQIKGAGCLVLVRPERLQGREKHLERCRAAWRCVPRTPGQGLNRSLCVIRPGSSRTFRC